MAEVKVQTPAAEAKPGWKTTEFWFCVIADLLGMAMASGALESAGETSWVTRIVGGAVAVLATLGYTAARAKVKAKE